MKYKFLIAVLVAFFMISAKVYADDYTVPITTTSGATYTITLHVDGKVTGIEATKGITVGKPVLVVAPTLEITGTFTKLYPNALKDSSIERDEFRGINFYSPKALDWTKPGALTEGVYTLPYVGNSDNGTWIIVNVSAVYITSPLPTDYNLSSLIFLADGKRLPMNLLKFGKASLDKSGKVLSYAMTNLDSVELEQLRTIATAKKVKVQVIFADPETTSSARTITKAEQQYIGQALAIYEMMGGK